MEANYIVVRFGELTTKGKNRKLFTQKLLKNTKDTSWDFDETFYTMKIRICKFRINEPGTGKEEWKVLLTNLDKVEFPLEKIKYLYHLRWRIGAEK